MVDSNSPALEAREVSVRYTSGTHALRGVSLAVARGETVALIGESGSGKTTLLRTFNRLIEPESGEVLKDGEPLRRRDPIALRRQLGYVQQEGGLLPHWTVSQNVGLVPSLQGWGAAQKKQRVDEMLSLVGLPPSEFGDRFPRQLSGGQRQRVAFARALAADPTVVLLDEPFGALDPLSREALQEEFLAWKTRLGKTLVLVTHDLHEAFLLADRVAVMRSGQIEQCAETDTLRAHPQTEYVAQLLARHARSTR